MAKSFTSAIRGLFCNRWQYSCSWSLTRRLPPQRKRYAQNSPLYLAAGRTRPRDSITARGMGTDVGGAALGSGSLWSFRPTCTKSRIDQNPLVASSGTIFWQTPANPAYPWPFCTVFPTLLIHQYCGFRRYTAAAKLRQVRAVPVITSRSAHCAGQRELIETGRISKRELPKRWVFQPGR